MRTLPLTEREWPTRIAVILHPLGMGAVTVILTMLLQNVSHHSGIWPGFAPGLLSIFARAVI
jgi:hypothetical protein